MNCANHLTSVKWIRRDQWFNTAKSARTRLELILRPKISPDVLCANTKDGTNSASDFNTFMKLFWQLSRCLCRIRLRRPEGLHSQIELWRTWHLANALRTYHRCANTNITGPHSKFDPNIRQVSGFVTKLFGHTLYNYDTFQTKLKASGKRALCFAFSA